MADLNFIVRYTDALYRNEAAICPRYEEFRDMFSSGQIQSKVWLIEELGKFVNLKFKKIVIVGSWFSSLAFLLLQKFSNVKILCLDLDKRCEIFVNSIITTAEKEYVRAAQGDMFKHSYVEDLIINTSCEHIKNLDEWLKLLPAGSTVVLQSTNYLAPTDHINPVNSLEEFINQTQGELQNILFSGEIDLKVYKRFMIIGHIK